MWTFECSAETDASRGAVWALWSDPTGWPKFDPNIPIPSASIDGPFAAGTTGKLKPKGGPTSSFTIDAAEPEKC